MIYFEWDAEKAQKNLRDHNVAFEDARAVFLDPYRLTAEDSVVDGEQRWRSVGLVGHLVVLLVAHLEEADEDHVYVRMISARPATPGERRDYEQNRTNDVGRSDQF